MSEEELETLAFKDRKKLANLNSIDLLEIIEFLQLDRKAWISQYTKAHNDYVELQQENQNLKGAIETYDILLKSNVKSTKVIEELEKYLEENKYFYSGLQNEDREEDTSIIGVLDKLKQLQEEE